MFRHIACSIAFAIIMVFPYFIRDLDVEYKILKDQYPQLKSEWFLQIVTECYRYRTYSIKPSDICAIIEEEGHWIPSIIHDNYKNGELRSKDFGLMQINSIHERNNYDLMTKYLDPICNIRKGIYEYSLCLDLSRGDKKEANRLYNAGRGNKREDYKNWRYVDLINSHRDKSDTAVEQFFARR